jgi:hypothetical protein
MKKVIFTIYVFIISINAIAQNIVLQEILPITIVLPLIFRQVGVSAMLAMDHIIPQLQVQAPVAQTHTSLVLTVPHLLHLPLHKPTAFIFGCVVMALTV